MEEDDIKKLDEAMNWNRDNVPHEGVYWGVDSGDVRHGANLKFEMKEVGRKNGKKVVVPMVKASISF